METLLGEAGFGDVHYEPTAADRSIITARKPGSPLTPEEQMALFEKDLKENDWGHQPC